MRIRRTQTNAGYTLLEILIAIVIMGIGFLALIAVQLGALRGYISTRDSLHAAEVGRRVAEVLRIQGQQWVDATWTGSAAYTADDNPFDVADPIGAINGAGGAWVSLYDLPADFAAGRPADASDPHLGGKFCAFARGGVSANDPSILQYQIAIVYPGPNTDLLSCDTVDAVALGEVGGPTTAPTLDAAGLRVSYYGTVVTRRSHLATDEVPTP